MSMKEVASLTFEAQLHQHGSWGARDMGTYTSTMRLYFDPEDAGRGVIEWEVPEADEYEEIGLQFGLDEHSQRTLQDYDGIMALPVQACDLMRAAGILVPDEYDDRRGKAE